MKTSSSTIEFKNATCHPPLSLPLKQTSQIVEFHDDIEYSSVTEMPEPVVGKQALAENHPVLLGADRMQVPVSLMRMIEHITVLHLRHLLSYGV